MRFLRKGPRLPYETRARWPERCRLGGSCRKSPTSGNPTISKRFPRRIRHQCGISLLPEQEQTRDAVVEANTWTTIQTDFLDQLIRENCLGVQDNLETVVEFVLRSPRWELSLVAPWLRLQPAKVAPFSPALTQSCVSFNLVSCLQLPDCFAPCYLDGQIGFRREADFNLRRCCLAAWTVERPPALFLTPERIRGQRACIHKVGERACSGSGSRNLV